MADDKGFTVRDLRGQPHREVCRVCSSPDHASGYNQPTMECVKALREEVRVAGRELLAWREWRKRWLEWRVERDEFDTEELIAAGSGSDWPDEETWLAAHPEPKPPGEE